MKPVRLTMQAFGPYSGREVVDFRQAINAGLFGIYGETGAGKSSIFSAMTFALFGKPAKSEQEASTLRSDHADSALLTEVEFIFDIGAERYVVRRRPEQGRRKQRGTGETKEPHAAWLFNATGLAVDAISETNMGKCLAETKVGIVDAAIEERLGYGIEQFRQIVLLPQGKFETFLTSKTDARLEILRELFDVSIYRRLAAKMKDDAANAERQVREVRDVCAGRLKAEGFDGREALDAGIIAATLAREEQEQQERAIREQAAAARQSLEAGRSREALFVSAQATHAAFVALEARQDEFRSLQHCVEQARQAQTLADVERHWQEAKSAVAVATQHRDDALRLCASTQQDADQAALALEKELARVEERETLRKESETLDRHLLTLKEADLLKAGVDAAIEQTSDVKRRFSAAEDSIVRKMKGKSDAEARLEKARISEAERQSLMAQSTALGVAWSAAREFEKTTETVLRTREKVIGLRAEYQQAHQHCIDELARFKAAEAALAAVQAQHLASRLLPAAPCPVCGSRDHPAPATGDAVQAGRDKAFRDAKSAYEKAQSDKQDSRNTLTAAEAALKVHEDRLAEMTEPERSAVDIKSDVDDRVRKIDALGPVVDLAVLDSQVKNLAQELAGAELIRDTLRPQRELAQQREAEARGKLDQALAPVPEELRQPQVLQKAQKQYALALKTLQDALASAEASARSTREAALIATNNRDARTIALVEAQARCAKDRATFEKRLAEAALTEARYETFKALIASMARDAALLEEYRRNYDIARLKNDAAHQAIMGLERPDVEALKGVADLAEVALQEATTLSAKAQAHLARLAQLRMEIDEQLERLDIVEKQTGPVRELAALFNADNPQRLDLETYAIGAMFDQVLAAANLRLSPMTKDRYVLERESDMGFGRARRGLGIRVFDLHTGKARAPTTLSGGETFITALALALGLSDVVESVSGKVHLDTIFIDEGFGSLDTEDGSGTLEQVLQVLTNLGGKSRSVGLISHVPRVREMIPNGFTIIKEQNGSRIVTRDIF